MANYLRHAKRHPEAGKWGLSMWVWHILEWDELDDFGYVDGASLCDTYVHPPYLDEPPSGGRVCERCRRLAEAKRVAEAKPFVRFEEHAVPAPRRP